jgi:16S rRNA (uracil1498-N3)-methyltransferase
MADRFYINCPLAPGPVRIQGAEAHHLATVCRLRPGDPVCLFNGDGHEYPATVQSVSRKEVQLQILGSESPERELPMVLTLAAPLPKGDRAQFLVEKLTELGVTKFIPLRTRRSVVHPGQGKREKLERYVIEASKQCGRNVLMEVEPVTDWPTYCQDRRLPSRKVLAHSAGATATWTRSEALALAVGPEGGFTDDEVELARSCGWQVVSLGPRTLRIETAALVLASWAVQSSP